ncbi:putative phosphoesterase [Labilithrix luteola]|uniref:Putative phosphoesterase n=1 Tax=Labilithrix luteola TaxID=1391654 RepID=A0A0K1Q1W9_9BACT|nr:metallophosphoesterase [Labilithrix luteola]AKU99364.1 putative phosphoesterase [Labilithrix luteola]
MPIVPLALAAAVGTTLAYSRIAAGRRDGIAVTWHRIPWRGERSARVVQLTDIHVGPTTPRRVLSRVADVVRTLDCDLVALTGDYVNASVFHVHRMTELVRSLPAPCVAVLGNHDHWANADRVQSALESGGARVLRNESTVVEGRHGALTIVGVDDGRSRHADVVRAFANVRDPERALVLTHYPNTAEEIAPMRAPLVLSGHTHAGQIDVPRVTAMLAKLTGHRYLQGFYRVSETTELYVNAGIGHSMHGFRAGRTCPEIAVFELDPEADERRSTVLRAALWD